MSEIKQISEEIRQKGTGEDTVLAHITPQEAELLKLIGGTGEKNPETGLPEYKSLWSKIKNAVVAAAAVIIVIVAPELAPAIGEAMGLTGAAAEVAGTMVINAGVTAAQGGNAGDIAKAAALSGVTAGIGQTVGDLGTGNIAKQYGLGETAQAGISGFTKGAVQGTSSGLLQGKNLEDSLKQGAISGGVSGLSAAFYPSSKDDPWTSKLAKAGANTAVRYELGKLFSADSAGQGATSYNPSANIGRLSQGAGTRAGSSALAQALDTGEKTDISGSDVSKKARNVWNQSSLKTSDEIGSSNG